MSVTSLKSLLVAAFSLMLLISWSTLAAQQSPESGTGQATPKTEEKIDPSKIILEHVSDGYEFHFFTIGDHPISIPLPVILYSKAKGLSIFMSSAFHHGLQSYNGYLLLEEKFLKEHNLDTVRDSKGAPIYKTGKIYALTGDGLPDTSVQVFDFSLTRNVTQMLLTSILLILIMLPIARTYAKGPGTTTAPSGFQNAIEPVITFIRDEVGKSNLGLKYEAYMPFLLTVFFFILINNLVGLVPGAANVSGNIAFTGILGLIAFVVLMFNTNRHFWSHTFNPPVPMGVKPIMIPVEIMGIFTKPFALIIRLFANMISGHIIILSFICLIFIFGAMNVALGWGTSPFFVLLAVFIYLIEILVAFIQAYIFTNLTAVFISMYREGEIHAEHSLQTETDAAVI